MGLIGSYNLRSMVVRKSTALMTAMGIAMVVAVFVMTLSIAQGFRAGGEVLRLPARDGDGRARGRETGGDAETDPGAPSGDERDAPRQEIGGEDSRRRWDHRLTKASSRR